MSLPLTTSPALLILFKGLQRHLQILWAPEKIVVYFFNKTYLEWKTDALSHKVVAGTTPTTAEVDLDWWGLTVQSVIYDATKVA